MNRPDNDYSSPRTLGDLVVIVTIIEITFRLLMVGWNCIGTVMLHEYSDVPSGFKIIQLLLELAAFFADMASSIVFLMWIYRSHRNLPTLGATGLNFSPVSAVAWWFAPFLNFIFPFLAVREIWRASDPRFIDTTSWKDAPISPILDNWWSFWILSCILSWTSFIIIASSDPIEYFWVSLLANVCVIIAEILCILIIKEITRRQEVKYRG